MSQSNGFPPLDDAAEVLFVDPDDTFDDAGYDEAECPEMTLDLQIEYAEFAVIAAKAHLDDLLAQRDRLHEHIEAKAEIAEMQRLYGMHGEALFQKESA